MGSSACDAVVVGSGMSGLTAALLLARAGRKVALVERNAKLAPLLRGWSCNGVDITAGFHLSGALQPKGPLSVLWGYLGAMRGIELEPLDPNAFLISRIDDDEPFAFPQGWERMRAMLCERFPGSARVAGDYIRQMSENYRAKPFLNYDCPAAGLLSGISTSAATLGNYLDGAGCDPRMRRLIDLTSTIFSGMSADEIPIEHHNLVMGGLYQSAHTIRGGGKALVGAFEAALDREGVETIAGNAARQILLDDRRRVRGVELESGDRFETAQCICTIHPQLVARLFDRQTEPPRALRRIEGRPNTFALFSVFYKLPKLPEILNRSIYFRAWRRHDSRWPANCLFIAGSRSPNGSCLLSLMAPCIAPARGREEMVDWMTGKFEDVFPGGGRGAERVAALTPQTYEGWTGTIGGSAYGLKHGVKRPLQPFTDISGFYLAGHSILMNGLGGASISGLVAAGHILGHENVWARLKQWHDGE